VLSCLYCNIVFLSFDFVEKRTYSSYVLLLRKALLAFLTPASKVDPTLSSVTSCLLPKSQPTCLPLIETASVVLFHPSACVVLKVLP
jgi:hypothetical protein